MSEQSSAPDRVVSGVRCLYYVQVKRPHWQKDKVVDLLDGRDFLSLESGEVQRRIAKILAEGQIESGIDFIYTDEAHHCTIAPRKPEHSRVVVPPGSRLFQLTGWGMDPEAHRTYVLPAIADLQLEYIQAREAGRPLLAWYTLVRGYASILPCWLYGMAARVLKWTVSS